MQVLQRLKHLLSNGQIKKINLQIIITYSSESKRLEKRTGQLPTKHNRLFSVYNYPSASAILSEFHFMIFA